MIKKRINLRNLGLFLIIFFIISLIYGSWFSGGMIARGDWKARSSDWMLNFIEPPSIWDEIDFGGISFLLGGRLTRFPLLHLQAHLHKFFNLGFEWTERLIWFFPFLIIATFSIYILSLYLFKDILASFFATIYFIANNFIVFRLHGAQLTLGMSYALTPLSIYFFIRGLEEKKINLLFLNGVILSLIAYYDFRIVPLVLFVEFFYGLYHKRVYWLVKSLFLTIVFLFFSNIFWLLPLMADFGSALPADVVSAPLADFKSLSRTDFFNALVLSIGSDSKKGGFIYLDGQIISAVLLVFLVIIYVFPFLIKPRKKPVFWLLLSIFFAFFAKGFNSPLSIINTLFYKWMPLATMYRLPTKFLLVGAMPISICFGLGCKAILERIEENIEAVLVVFVALAFLPIFTLSPALWGPNSLKSMKGGSSFNPFLAEDYFEFENWLGRQSGQYKSMFLPGAPSYYFFSRKFPRYEPLGTSQIESKSGSYFEYRFETLNGLQSPDDKVLPQVLRLLNVRYIFLAPRNGTMWAWYSEGMYDQFQKMLLGIEEFKKTENENIFIIEDSLPRFFISDKLVYLDGDLEEDLGQLLDVQVDFKNLTLVKDRTAVSISPKDVAAAVSSGEFKAIPADSSEIKVEETGRAKYKITIFNPPKSKFYLNFQDGYDSNWQINDENKASLTALGTNYFPLSNEAGHSHLELILEHRLQKYLDLGWRIYRTFVLVVIVYLGFWVGRKSLRKLMKKR